MDVYAEPQRLVKVGARRRLNLHVAGDVAPTVILSAGFGGGNLDWVLAHGRIARFARVVAYEHAGLGFSDPGRLPRTPGAIVADLRAALDRAGISPPYVLVGHSAGGVHMRRFAALRPAEVAGLVLVDSVTDDFVARVPGGLGMDMQRATFGELLELARAGQLTPDTQMYRQHVSVPQPGLTPRLNAAMHEMRTRPSYYRALISESLALERGRGPSSGLGDLPLVVLSAERIGDEPFMDGDPARVAAWYGMHAELAALSTRGVRRMVDAGHNIPIEQPTAVVAAIEEVLAMVRA